MTNLIFNFIVYTESAVAKIFDNKPFQTCSTYIWLKSEDCPPLVYVVLCLKDSMDGSEFCPMAIMNNCWTYFPYLWQTFSFLSVAILSLKLLKAKISVWMKWKSYSMGSAFVRYLHAHLFSRNSRPARSFRANGKLVRKYHTRALPMKYSLFQWHERHKEIILAK